MKRKFSPSPSYHNLINFIPETQQDLPGKKDKDRTKKTQTNSNIGKDVRTFYESLTSSEAYQSSPMLKEVPKPKKHHNFPKEINGLKKNQSNDYNSKKKSTTSVPEYEFFTSQAQSDPAKRQHLKLLGYSQLGKKTEIKELLNKGINIDFKDFYGWTALMCASKEGHIDVIKLLLKCGANKALLNTSGDSAVSLAVNAGHSDAALILQSWDCDEKFSKPNKKDVDKNLLQEMFTCDICKRDFSRKEEASHKTSTVHLFNSGFKSNGPAYFIPDSNRGFQMMLRSGWNVQNGLGPKGNGLKYPIKTVLKKDRSGLGGEDVKRKNAKVTHFNRDDKDAVKSSFNNPTRQISVGKAAKIAAKCKEKRMRRWEQKLRYEMS